MPNYFTSDIVISSTRALHQKSTHKLLSEIKKGFQTILILNKFHESLQENVAISDESNDQGVISVESSYASDV